MSSTLWDRPIGASTGKLNPTQIKKLESIATSKRFGFTRGSSTDPRVRTMRHVLIPTLVRHLSNPKWRFEVREIKRDGIPFPRTISVKSETGDFLIQVHPGAVSYVFSLVKDLGFVGAPVICSRAFNIRHMGSTKEVALFFAKRIQTEFIREVMGS